MKLATVFLATIAALGQPQVTIYNKNFAAVKERRTLSLKPGLNELRVTDVTGQLEPDSVVLRALDSASAVRILEQNYEREPLSETSLLRAAEGKVVEFEVSDQFTGEKKVVKARILRSQPALQATPTSTNGYQPPAQVVVELVDNGNKIEFGLPGRPLFESLGIAGFLKPTLVWKLDSDRAGSVETEFSYMTGGLRWEATYNVMARDKGDSFNVDGWVTIENSSGKTFENAAIKLMGGDVARAQPQFERLNQFAMLSGGAAYQNAPRVTERTFDEYHLYTLARPTTILDREVKQVEFIRAEGVPAKRIYIYDGLKSDTIVQMNDYLSRQATYASGGFNPKVWTMLEFTNNTASNLGMPLPAGKVKVYRTDTDGRNEFIGEDRIDHTPKNETARVYLGNAFDLAGERRQVSFQSPDQTTAKEEFEIKVRNHKNQPVEVRVIEHLYRGVNWKITEKTATYTQTDSRTIEFHPAIAANGEAVIRYKVVYSW